LRADGTKEVIVLSGQDVVVELRRGSGRDVVRPNKEDKQDQ